MQIHRKKLQQCENAVKIEEVIKYARMSLNANKKAFKALLSALQNYTPHLNTHKNGDHNRAVKYRKR